MQRADVVVVGGGIVGLAVAHTLLQRRPSLDVRVLEKETEVGQHQTGHNSGVIHSGIYYRPGSLKARLSREGGEAMFRFAAAHGIPHARTGKVIVARNASELAILRQLYERGKANGLQVELLGNAELRAAEPFAVGVQAIRVPETGIVDFRAVALALAEEIRRRGGSVWCAAEVIGLREQDDGVEVTFRRRGRAYGDEAAAAGEEKPRRAESAPGGEDRVERLYARQVINAAGLMSDRVARLSGARPDVRIVPFRGQYHRLRPERSHLVRGLIYPVPKPNLPFLGVHFTRMTSGDVHVGPNAVLALAREGYAARAVKMRDVWETFAYPGVWRLAWRYRREGLREMIRAWNKAAFVHAAQGLIPAVASGDLIPAESGIRVQALRRDGTLADDFVIDARGRILHILNAPSPAATAALAIGAYVTDIIALMT